MTKKNYHPEDADHHLAYGIILGGVIAAAAALLAYTKAGKQLQHQLSGICNGVSNQAKDFAHEIAEKTGNISHGITGHFITRKPRLSHSHLFIGGIAGAILGASAFILLSQNGSQDIYHNLAHTFHALTKKTHEIGDAIEEKTHDVMESVEDRLGHWVQAAQKAINGFQATEKNSHVQRHHESTLDHALDWALLGIRLFQSLKK